MAHYAELDNNNVVLNVLRVDNIDMIDENGIEHEHIGIEYLKNLFGEDKIYKQTSYNNNIRARYAVIGGTYDPNLDVFLLPKPFPSWSIDPITKDWAAPIPEPNDGNTYYWDEENMIWVQDNSLNTTLEIYGDI